MSEHAPIHAAERLPFPPDWALWLKDDWHIVSPLWRLILRMRFWLFQRHRYNRRVWEHVAGRDLLILPTVFNPKLFRTGAYLASALDERLIRPGAKVLDIGTGSGIGAIFAAQWADRVIAVDINPEAVRCAQINALLHHLESRVEVCQGDLFQPVESMRFDVVLFNPPYFRGTPRDALDQAWRSLDVVERFAAGLSRHLAPEGYAVVVLSTDGEAAAFLEAFHTNGLACALDVSRNLINEKLLLLRVIPSAKSGARDGGARHHPPL
jgi:release factor glutamine methyltransferase